MPTVFAYATGRRPRGQPAADGAAADAVAGARCDVVSLDSGHVPQLAMPGKLADCIIPWLK